jgi:hypothetical protein
MACGNYHPMPPKQPVRIFPYPTIDEADADFSK